MKAKSFSRFAGVLLPTAVTGNYLVPDRTNRQLPKEHFRRALARAPLGSTSVLQDLQGPSYLYTILMDERIRPSWDTSHGPPGATQPSAE